MKLLLLGDICPAGLSEQHFKSGDTAALFSDVYSIFNKSDYTFANLECAITESDNKIKKFGPNLKAPKNTVKVLNDIGVTHVSLSNNHVFDFGIKGITDTIKALNEGNIGYTGFGENYTDSRKNLVVEKNGEKICLIAVCEHEYSYALDDRMGSRPFDEFETPEDIREAKKTCDKVIVMYHGGKEHCCYPSPRLQRACHAMARSGADIILCQHSHAIGCYEKYDDCHIVYGQGNFHFAALNSNVLDLNSTPITWLSGMAIEYDTEKDDINFIFCTLEGDHIELAKGSEKEAFENAFKERNEALKNGEWKNKWHEFCEENKAQYIKNIKEVKLDENQLAEYNIIGHYLDCEAHRDFLMEIFQTANQTNEK